MRWLDGIIDQWTNEQYERRTEEPHVLQSMGWQIVRHNLATEQQVKASSQDGTVNSSK